MNWVIDMDGAISVNPTFFSFLTYILHKNKHWIDIVTSRNPSRVEETKKELEHWHITYDDLHFMAESMPRDYKTQGEWKVNKIGQLQTDIWIDNEFKIYEEVCGVDFSECKATRLAI